MIIYAIDDEPILLSQLIEAIKAANPNAEVLGYSKVSTLLSELESKDKKPDYAFLDIELPGMNGIELAKRIKLLSPSVLIIFVTAFSNYAVEAFGVHAAGYVMKPVTEAKIRKELEYLSESIQKTCEKGIRVKCFGNFEVFVENKPLRFSRSKTKELFAYLIDRNGAAVNTGELCSILWEDKQDLSAQKNYLRKLMSDLSKTLSDVGYENIFIKSRNSFSIDPSKIECDYYRFLEGDAVAVNSYFGEYMTQFSWAELTLAGIENAFS